MVKNLPAMQDSQEMLVRFLGQEDLQEEEMATHSSILAWKISWVGYSPWGCKDVDTTERLSIHVHKDIYPPYHIELFAI